MGKQASGAVGSRNYRGLTQRRAEQLGLAVLAGVAALAVQTHAAAPNWSTAVSGTWDDTARWSTSAKPVSGDSVTFNAAGNNGAETIYLNGNQAALSLTFSNTGTTTLLGGISGSPTNNTLTLSGGTLGITLSAGAGAVTIGDTAASPTAKVDLSISANVTLQNNSASALTIANGITGAFLVNASAGNTVLNGPLNIASFRKTSGGTATLAGSNTFTNFIQFFGNNAGTIKLANTAATNGAYVDWFGSTTGNSLQYATDGGDNIVNLGQFASGTIVADRATAGVDASHSLGTVSVSGAGGTMSITRGSNVSGTGTVSIASVLLLSGTAGEAIFSPGTGTQLVLNNVTAVTSTVARTLRLDGTASGRVIGNITSGTSTLFSISKQGTSTWDLSGTNNVNGALTLGGGRLNISAGTTDVAGATSVITEGSNATSTLGVSSGATLNFNSTASVVFGNGLTSSTAVLLNAGTVRQTTNADGVGMNIGSKGGAYGYIRNSGALTVSGQMLLGSNTTNSFGQHGSLLDVAGGTVTVLGANQTTAFAINNGGLSYTNIGHAGVNVTGGGSLELSRSQTYLVNKGSRQYASLNVSGVGSRLVTGVSGGLDLNNTAHVDNYTVLAISSGGSVQTSFIDNTGGASTVSPAKGILSFNDGTLKATASDGTALIRSSVTTYIHAGGATIDTGSSDVNIATILRAPTGLGVTAINGTNTTGYVAAPIVRISGGSGGGAAAAANFDGATGNISFTLTGAGSGYSAGDSITFALVGGKGTNTGAAVATGVGTVTLGAVSSGGLTKTGAGALTLSAANTYTGGTSVAQGKLVLAGSVNGSVNVQGGASLELQNGNAIVDTGTLSLAGGSTINLQFGSGDVENPVYESVGSLVLGGTVFNAATVFNQANGYQGYASYFTGSSSGAGIQVVPEPTGLALVGIVMGGLLRRRRRA